MSWNLEPCISRLQPRCIDVGFELFRLKNFTDLPTSQENSVTEQLRCVSRALEAPLESRRYVAVSVVFRQKSPTKYSACPSKQRHFSFPIIFVPDSALLCLQMVGLLLMRLMRV